MRIARVVACAALAVGSFLATTIVAEEGPITIRAGRFLDGRGPAHTGVSIVVEGARITSVAATAAAPQGRVIDLSRLTVLPGLIDVHDHLVWHFNAAGRLHTDDDGEKPAASALAAAHNAWQTLLAGFTTVQSPGSSEDADLRAAIEAGLPGPRLLTSLEPLGEDEAATSDAYRLLVRERKGQGADFIKVFASKSIRQGGAPTLSQDQLDAICGEAKLLGLRTLVHAHSSEAIRRAVAAGCTQVEHGVLADDATLVLMAEHGTWFDPQCGLIFRNYLENKANYVGIGNYTEEAFDVMQKAIPTSISIVGRAARTPKLKLVFGTDAVAGAHGHNATDLVCRSAEAGVPALDVLRSATSLAAESMGLANRIGALAPGLEADIIAVDGDPLVDPHAYERVAFVMRAGRIYRDDAR
jgi:imidazolonepropionase-like amidohydrolase